MHTPDDPQRAEKRAALRETSKLLIALHRALIDAARDEYSATRETVTSPGQMLRLLQEDPFFAWLKPMTSLIVDIDEMVRVDFQPADVEAIVARLDRLFGPVADEAFSAPYVAILQRDVDVAGRHAALRPVLARLRG